MSTKHTEWLAFLQGVNRLYETKFGHPPTNDAGVKAQHFIKWRFGDQVLVDAIARIEELETQASAASRGFVNAARGL